MHLLKDVFEDDLICSSGWTAREAASTEKEAIRIRVRLEGRKGKGSRLFIQSHTHKVLLPGKVT